MGKEFKTFKLELRELKPETGEFTGYASTFGKVDAYNDFVEPGAFRKTLKENKGKVAIFYMHETRIWIGLGQKAKEDDKGLFVTGKLDIAVNQRAMETFSLMTMCQEQERPAGLSIGFEAMKWEIVKEKDRSIRHLKEIKLWEYSPTPPGFHADYGAMITEMKAHVGLNALVEAVLKDTSRAAGTEVEPGKAHSSPHIDALEKVLSTLRR